MTIPLFFQGFDGIRCCLESSFPVSNRSFRGGSDNATLRCYFSNRDVRVPQLDSPSKVVLLILLLAALMAGCVSLQEYTFDNARIRQQQEESLGSGPNLVDGTSLTQFFGPRTAWIMSADSGMLDGNHAPGSLIDVGGRAAAVSNDGYFLTAGHVVEGGMPVMVLSPFHAHPGARPGTIDGQPVVLSPGRIVQHFAPADLALVKFEWGPSAHFSVTDPDPSWGAEVFTAATSGVLIDDRNRREAIGNGPFQARGRIVHSRKHENRPDVLQVTTTIPVRGGMSGAPVADADGKLIGILTAGTMSRLRYRAISSELQQIDAKVVFDAIENDRRSQPQAGHSQFPSAAGL